MLPKELRLKKKSEIEYTFKSGKTLKSLHFICKFTQNNLGINRPCVTIAKNLKLNAVTKNRFKRQIISAFKNSQDAALNQSFDIVIILKKLPSKDLNRYNCFLSEFNKLINQFHV